MTSPDARPPVSKLELREQGWFPGYDRGHAAGAALTMTQSRDELVLWLQDQAAEHATGSRDFGRGFSHAIRVLSTYPG